MGRASSGRAHEIDLRVYRYSPSSVKTKLCAILTQNGFTDSHEGADEVRHPAIMPQMQQCWLARMCIYTLHPALQHAHHPQGRARQRYPLVSESPF